MSIYWKTCAKSNE